MRSDSSGFVSFKLALHVFFLCVGFAFAYSVLIAPYL